jgi:hypothetical protein
LGGERGGGGKGGGEGKGGVMTQSLYAHMNKGNLKNPHHHKLILIFTYEFLISVISVIM